MDERIKVAEEAREQADWGYEDSDYSRDDWKVEVGMSSTQLGYFDWVIHKLEAVVESGEEI